jgi:NitT/TauT family transport system ATP-binding protein
MSARVDAPGDDAKAPGLTSSAHALSPTVSFAAPVTPAPDSSVVVALEHISKRFGAGVEAVQALDNISLQVRQGEFVCIVGASGCGKSTLLNLVAGLDTPTSGAIRVDSQRTALMFQEAALFPWLTVAENVEFPLRTRGVGRAERRRTIEALLDSVQLNGFAKRRPHELSGGMRQRVALARALAQDAGILLMDEPFGSLDAMIRDLLDLALERLWSRNKMTILLVTHDVREAVRLGSRVLLFSSRPGRVAAEFPIDLERPRLTDSPEVARIATEITGRLAAEVLPYARL